MKKNDEIKMFEDFKENIIDFEDDILDSNLKYNNENVFLFYKQDEIEKIYMKEISEIPLLTKFEEKDLFQIIQEIKKCHFIKYGIDKNIEFDYLKLLYFLTNIEYSDQKFDLLSSFFDQIKQPSCKKILKKYLILAKSNQHFLTKEEIKKYFNLSIQNINTNITEQELLEDIKVYINYLNAKEKIIKANLRLVLSEAKKLSYPFISIFDLASEGNIGLTIAVDRFDPKKTDKFSTFATPWIRRYILEYINKNSNGSITLNRSFFNYYRKIIKKLNEFQVDDYEHLDYKLIKKIANELNMNEATVKEHLYFARATYSLDKRVNDEKDKDDTVFGDFIADKENNVEDIFEKKYLFELMESLLNNLTDDEKYVICLRYGIGTKDNKIYTLKEAEKILGVTYETIRLKEKKALLKLKKIVSKNQHYEVLKDYIR